MNFMERTWQQYYRTNLNRLSYNYNVSIDVCTPSAILLLVMLSNYSFLKVGEHILSHFFSLEQRYNSIFFKRIRNVLPMFLRNLFFFFYFLRNSIFVIRNVCLWIKDDSWTFFQPF